MIIKIILISTKIWLFLELLNWFAYLFIYINIISPKFMKYKEIDKKKIIERLDKLSKNELEYMIRSCVIYNKLTHSNVDRASFDIKNLSLLEITNLIRYSLFGLEMKNTYTLNENKMIYKLITKIELKLGYNFKKENTDRFLYLNWGGNFIKFSCRPLFLQIPMKIITTVLHIIFTLYLGFKWEQINKIGFLSKKPDPNKKNIIFIHGFGFGYVPYFLTLLELNKKYNLIILVLPNISSYNYYDDVNYSYFPPLTQISDTIYNFFESKQISNIILLSHSFGTYVTQFIRKDERSSVFSKIILVDPIIFWISCFKTSLHIENQFVKKSPYIMYLFVNLINFIVYQCLYFKYVCHRVMFGPDFWIYDASELETHKNLIIILEKSDYIIPAELLYNKIKNYVKCYYFNSDEFNHGTILIEPKYFEKLIEIIEDD